jgi:hypothetical protein
MLSAVWRIGAERVIVATLGLDTFIRYLVAAILILTYNRHAYILC